MPLQSLVVNIQPLVLELAIFCIYKHLWYQVLLTSHCLSLLHLVSFAIWHSFLLREHVLYSLIYCLHLSWNYLKTYCSSSNTSDTKLFHTHSRRCCFFPLKLLFIVDHPITLFLFLSKQDQVLKCHKKWVIFV